MNMLMESKAAELTDGVPVAEVMSGNIQYVYEGTSVRKLTQFFLEKHISGAPVIAADGELVGVVTHSDIVRFTSRELDNQEVRHIIERYSGPLERPLPDSEIMRIKDRANDYCTANTIMNRAVFSVDISADLTIALNTLFDKNVHRLFVTDQGILVGVVTAMDILRYLAKPG